MVISKDEFECYEDCRTTGITNMLIIKNVMAMTKLPKEKILEIMENYEELAKKFS